MNKLNRRRFSQCVSASAALFGLGSSRVHAKRARPAKGTAALDNAIWLGNRLVQWQAPWGGPDPEKCPYRSPDKFTAFHLHGLAPSVKALYRLHQATGESSYRDAADRYAMFFLNAIHDVPPEPVMIKGEKRISLSSAWMLGKGLSPCYEWFRKFHPEEDGWDIKAHAVYRWLQHHRNEQSYFGVGYPCGEFPDAQFSCDLGEVGSGLVGFHATTGHAGALQDALGLAKFFLTDYEQGSGKGVWSKDLNVWLVGPWPGGGAEHFTNQVYNETGWGWSCLVAGEFLMSLYGFVTDDALKKDIADKVGLALQWCLDTCQFDDGALGMFGRDDKWVGMTAVPIRLVSLLKAADQFNDRDSKKLQEQVNRAWKWLVDHSSPTTFPEDGQLKVNGTTSKKPLENLVWLMAWTIEALLDGEQTGLG